VLELRLDRERAWATVGQALTRADVEVENQDQVEGVYYVRIPEEVLTGEEKGWLSGVLSRGKGGYDLQLHLQQVGDLVYHVSVTDGDAAPVDREFGQEVLTMVREFSS
jgi:uncharacterized lipoprotein